MARTKNPNFGLRDEIEGENRMNQNLVEVEDPKIFEEAFSGGEEEEVSGDDSDSTDSEEETEPLQPLKMYFQPTEYTKKINIATRSYITAAVETLLKNLKYPLKPEEKSWFLKHPQFRHFFHMHQHQNHKVMGMWMLLVRTACTEKKKKLGSS